MIRKEAETEQMAIFAFYAVVVRFMRL